MINLVKNEYGMFKEINSDNGILYSQDIKIDIDNLKLLFKNASMRPKFEQSKLAIGDDEISCMTIKRGSQTIYLLNHSSAIFALLWKMCFFLYPFVVQCHSQKSNHRSDKDRLIFSFDLNLIL